MTGIYKITNQINGKSYIGQSRNIKARFSAHKYSTQHELDNYAIHKAMKKYGIENFNFEIIEECLEERLNEREIYWIQYYDTYNKGYNSSLGGNGVAKYNRQEILNLWNKGFSEKEICQEINICEPTLSEILRYEFNISFNEIRNRANKHLCKAVEQYTLLGEYIATYLSAEEAETQLKITAHNIQSVCRQAPEYKSAGGFLWKYAKDSRSIKEWVKRKEKLENSQQKTVYQYTKDNKFVAKYSSTGEAARKVPKTNQQNISSVCRGKRQTCGGFKWSYTPLN